jgi:hypothetical protein
MAQPKWQKSSFSSGDGNSECLEVSRGEDGLVRIRESDEPDVVAVTTPAKWNAFIKGIKAGEFDHFVADPAEAE